MKTMQVRRLSFNALLQGFLICSSAGSVNVYADEIPSMDFLEYLGAEESKVDNEWTGPVDLDIEQYLVANQSDAKAPENSEDDKHE